MRKGIIIILCCMVCLCEASAATRRALIFGLGKQEDSSWTKIHGDNDARLVAQMLVKNGFSDIRTVVNEQATKAGMESAFMGLVKRCETGDMVYVHYSGHGQYMTDLNVDEAERWTGRHAKWDEAWIPYDAYMMYCDKDHGERHFCDDEVAEYMTQLRKAIGPKGQLYIVVDACHSGDATRGKNEECVRGVDTEFIIPKKIGEELVKPSEEEWLTISACKPYQLCFEHKKPQVGKLTYALYKLGERMFKMDNSELQSWLEGYMEANPSRLPQTPVVSGRNKGFSTR